MKKRGLGKGLDAIFSENTTDDGNSTVTLNINEIEPNRNQPRKSFDDDSLHELADSIAAHGLLQPILVRPVPGNGYQIVAGERRWRASRIAGLCEVPVVIRDMSDAEMAQIALVENLQREDLSPLEEAEGYGSLIETYGFTQEEVAKTVGKSRPAVTNALRLLNLPDEVKKLLTDGVISAGHARALLSFENEKDMVNAAKIAAEKGLSVRELENLSKKADKKPVKSENKVNKMYREIELALKEQLGRRVTVGGNSKKGKLEIEFYGEDDLKGLLEYFNK
jgi:ParB family chromosome partitioning protein